MKVRSINVLGKHINIKLVSEAKLAEKLNLDAEHYLVQGGWIPREACIYLNQDLSKDELKWTLIHEIVHAYLSISGLHNLLSRKLEESLCDCLANLASVISDNNFTEKFNG